MKTTLPTLRVLQAIGLTSFALATAVACGPGFAPKQMGSTTLATPGQKTTTTSTEAAPFSPSGITVKRSLGATPEELKLAVVFRDDAQDVSVQMTRAAGTTDVQGEVIVGTAQYTLVGYCEDVTTKSAEETQPQPTLPAEQTPEQSTTTDTTAGQQPVGQLGAEQQPAADQKPADQSTAQPTQTTGGQDTPVEQVGVMGSSTQTDKGIQASDLPILTDAQPMQEKSSTETCARLGLLIKKVDKSSPETTEESALVLQTQGDSMFKVQQQDGVSFENPKMAFEQLLGGAGR